jgi:hypothetical protein
MEPNEVAKIYLSQAEALEKFLSKLAEEKYTNEELILITRVIGEKYYELLINLAKYTPLLEAHKVKFYKIYELESKERGVHKLNLETPPFEIDFFNRNI